MLLHSKTKYCSKISKIISQPLFDTFYQTKIQTTNGQAKVTERIFKARFHFKIYFQLLSTRSSPDGKRLDIKVFIKLHSKTVLKKLNLES